MNRPCLPRLTRPSRRGSMLLEVMLAMGIFAIGVVGFAICLQKTMETVNYSRAETRIRQELQTRMEDLRQKRFVVETKSDDPDALGVQYTHEITLLQIESDRKTLLNNLYDVKVTAHWKEGGQDQERSTEVYVYQP